MPVQPNDPTATPPSAASYNAWARYYDAVEGDRGPYVDFYAGLVRDGDDAICELGCGTGAVLAPVVARLRAAAHPDLRAAGVDGSEEMLARGRERDPAIAWIHGDMRAPPLDARYDLVFCATNTFQVLLRDDDLGAAFAAARGLLAPGGRFAFDLYQPNLDWLRQPQHDRPGREVSVDGQRVQVRETARYDEAARVLHLDWRLVPLGDPATTLATIGHQIRQYHAADVERLLHAAGLRILERHGDLDRSPFHAGSRKQVLVCGAA
jgi:SAM-dependent methyltransferase